MRFARRCGAALLALLSVAAAPGPDAAATFAALRAADLRLATIGYRLTTANVPLCRKLAPTPGFVVHSLGQYDPGLRGAARAAFGFETPVAVEAVVAGSAAARAGVVADDSLVAVDGQAFANDPPGAVAGSGARDAAAALLARQPVGEPLRLELLHGGRRRVAIVPASPGCRARFELVLGPKMTAQSDGDIVQIGVRFLERYDDAQVAAVVAHELAHVVLDHRARLEAAGVSKGVLAEVGRNGRLNRRAEDEADLLSVHLMRNAGYDPQGAVVFWRDHGGDVDGGLFRSRTHGSSRARAKAIGEELGRVPADAPLPYVPPVLATRDEAFR